MTHDDHASNESGVATVSRVAGSTDNPYVGPRAYNRNEALPGRQREIEEVLTRVRSDRVLLIHSPSGAGKTSLLQSAVMPALENEYTVLSTLPVGLTPAAAAKECLHTNRYINTTLLSLAEKFPESAKRKALPHQSLAQALDAIRAADPDGYNAMYVIVFDQFEEVLSLDPSDWEAKTEFFIELGFAFRDERIAAIIAMREEWLGELEPYARLLPTRLGRRYRLEPLTPAGALEAIRRPADSRGAIFTQPAADRLLNSLLQVRVSHPRGEPVTRSGTTVEPLLLQVVCYSLWDRMSLKWEGIDGIHMIHENDVAESADLDSALSHYYAQQVKKAASTSQVSERRLRDWIEKQLVTSIGLRTHVLLEGTTAGGLDVNAVQALERSLLVRRDTVRAITWFELIHDRFVTPIRKDNLEWRAKFGTPLSRKAELWIALGERGSELLDDTELELLQFQPLDGLSEDERRYVTASKMAQTQRKGQRKQTIIRVSIGVALGLSLLIAVLVWQYQLSAKLRTYRWLATFQLDMQAELQSRTYDVVPPEVPSQVEIEWPTHQEAIPLVASEAYGEAERRADSLRAVTALASEVLTTLPDIALAPSESRPGATTSRTLAALGVSVRTPVAGEQLPNFLAVGRDVPPPIIRALALSMAVDGSPPAKIRKLPESAPTRQISLTFDGTLRAWPPLTTEQILRLTSTARSSPP